MTTSRGKKITILKLLHLKYSINSIILFVKKKPIYFLCCNLLNWAIPENIHTYTTGGILEFRGRGGVSWTGILKAWGGGVTQFGIPKAWGGFSSRFPEGGDESFV